MHRLQIYSFVIWIIFSLIIATPRFNLHYTYGVDDSLQHDCFRLAAFYEKTMNIYEIISYCLSETPTNYSMNSIISFSNFTFVELSKKNITSQDLYLWSAPLDLIEDYQFYLNQQQLSTSSNLSLSQTVFYNCTLPKFGPLCQYELVSYHSNYSSLIDIIHDFYENYDYDAITTLTCYSHLNCYRGPSFACLQWTEICNGRIDCFNGGFDEEDCWQLEINECTNDEYRCTNGQCIPKSFYQELDSFPDCLDGTDQDLQSLYRLKEEPFFRYEDVSSTHIFFTGLDKETRRFILMNTMYSSENNILSQNCSLALKNFVNFNNYTSQSFEYNKYIKIIQETCPTMFYFPNIPILFGDIYFAYKKNDFQYNTTFVKTSSYVCYNRSRYENYFSNFTKIIFNNTACIHSKPFIILPLLMMQYPSKLEQIHIFIIKELYQQLNRYNLIFNYTSLICNRSNMYQCHNSSKCISIYRLIDKNNDCPYMDDENMMYLNITNSMKYFDRTHYKCKTNGEYIPLSFVSNNHCDCGKIDDFVCDDDYIRQAKLKTDVVFTHICDGFPDKLPELINGRNETDETECEQWNCNNTYTRCNVAWNCLNGADEAGCPTRFELQCSSKEHLCVSFDTYELTCLPIEKANDGNVDCLGATDEPELCSKNLRTSLFHWTSGKTFYCKSGLNSQCIFQTFLCDNDTDCDQGDDERFCLNETITKRYLASKIYFPTSHFITTNVENFLINYLPPAKSNYQLYLLLDEPVTSEIDPMKTIEKNIFSNPSVIKRSIPYKPYCHRGLTLHVWSNNLTCLCPPSYYGSQCQYQNQRVALSIKFRALASLRQTLFAIVVTLFDNISQQIIHSYEQFTYLAVRDCQTKFNIYLLYSTRPKNPKVNYSIRIDIYDKNSFDYRGSLIYPIRFSFLPVYRLSVLIDIPRNYDTTQACSIDRCDHGQCIKYTNNSENDIFCQCDEGWSGKYCHIQHDCNCSSDSLCIGISANNRSICLCPVNKFGSRCLLLHTICLGNDSNSTCQNGGQCVANNDLDESNEKFSCICRQGFHGDRCQTIDNKLTLSFDSDVIISQSLSIHFIQIIELEKTPIISTTFRTIPVKQDSIIIYWSNPFHLVFIEFNNKNYYLALIQKNYKRSTSINTMINPSDHCPHVSQVLNKTIAQFHLLRRIKYYHLVCQTYSRDLKCFYDEKHLCLCHNFDNTHQANCFEFEHDRPSDCWGQSDCEHKGQCFQDKEICPQRSICVCPSCFYGVRCQFSTNGFGLSLDAILGYHIHSHLRLIEQSLIIQISLGLTIIFIVIGLLNGIFSLMTFKNKRVLEIGCGWYLLTSSVLTLSITIMFGLKYFIFLLIQMTIISNRLFLSLQCYSLDFILRIGLSMDQWLNACVAIERTFSVIQGVKFNKTKSKQTAKCTIIILFIVITITSIHDPIHRRIIDEDRNDDINNNQKRSWCIVTYSSNFEIYNYMTNIIHFFGPFLMNIIAAVVIIAKQARQKSNIHTDKIYREHLREQYQENRHLLISPIVLVVLAIPRLFIAFASKCMQSANDAWLFLIGYFIAFIPPMLTFLVFISPSKFYKEEFHKSTQQFRQIIQQHFSSV